MHRYPIKLTHNSALNFPSFFKDFGVLRELVFSFGDKPTANISLNSLQKQTIKVIFNLYSQEATDSYISILNTITFNYQRATIQVNKK